MATFANVWKETGWNSIIYIAAITGIDPTMYEAAELDGAGRFKKMWHVTIPGIKSTIVVLLVTGQTFQSLNRRSRLRRIRHLRETAPNTPDHD